MAIPPSRTGPPGPPPIDSSLPGRGDGAPTPPPSRDARFGPEITFADEEAEGLRPEIDRRPPPTSAAPQARTNSAREVKDSHEATTPRFWTNQFSAGHGFKTDPKFKYRFRVIFPGLTMEDDRGESGFKGKRFGADDPFFDRVAEHDAYVWWVKTISKPKINYQTEEEKFTTVGKLLSKRVSATPILEDITMTMIDPSYPNATRKLARIIRRTGYNEAQAKQIINDSYGGSIAESMLDTINGTDRRGVQIHQLDEFGEAIETWTLHNAFIKRIDFGELDYSSDELLEINLTLGYEAVKVFFPKYGREQEYPYFNDTADKSKEEEPIGGSEQGKRCEDRFKTGKENATIGLETTIEQWASQLADPYDPCRVLLEVTADDINFGPPPAATVVDFDPEAPTPVDTDVERQEQDLDMSDGSNTFNPDADITSGTASNTRF